MGKREPPRELVSAFGSRLLDKISLWIPLEYQWIIHWGDWLCANVLHAMLPIVAQKIEAEAVDVRLDQVDQFALEPNELFHRYRTLKYRVLHALAKILARFCHFL